MSSYNVQIVLPEGSRKPDTYELVRDRRGSPMRPSNDFVVSRDTDGNVVSRYGDPVWDLSFYSTTVTGSRAIYFSSWLPVSELCQLIEDSKWMLFMLMYIADTGRAGYLSVSYLCNRYPALLRDLCLYCYENRLTMRGVLTSEVALKKYVRTLNKSKIMSLSFILGHLLRIDSKISGYKAIGGKTISELKALTPSNDHQGTPVIPSRIYSSIIQTCCNRVTEFLEASVKIISFFEKSKEVEGFGASHRTQRKLGLVKGIYQPSFKDAVQAFGLSKHFEENGVRNLQQLSSYFSEVQLWCKHLIHAYSGMRDNEALSLKYDCLRIEKSESGRIVRILGETTKFVGVRKVDRWVTSEDVEPAIRAAKLIAKTICKYRGIELSDAPLFVAVGYLNLTGSNPDTNKKVCSRFTRVDINKISTKIEVADIEELEKIHPNRNWREDENFKIGTPWPLSSHQWRKSLVVYAAQSGLVSLPSLKRQLKHITREMSVYYASGASNAKKLFVASKEHIIHDYNRAKPEADALAYMYKILLSDDPLYGAHGIWVERNDKPKGKENIIKDRDKIVKRFKRGEIAYSETPLGACLAVAPCDKKAMRAVSACVSCAKATINPTKLARVIGAQRILVESLDEQSMEYRMEKEQLNDLEHIEQQIQVRN